MKVHIDDIKVSSRLRKIDRDKVDDLITSIKEIGLLHPIIIDNNNNLLAGWHRLEAHKVIGYKYIECKKVNLLAQKNKLVEIDENLTQNNLSIIEKAEHLVRRDEILISLGHRARVGDNQHTSGSADFRTTLSISKDLGISRRKYYEIKQIYNINHKARRILKDTDTSNNLNGLLQIEKLQDDDLQIEIASKIKGGYSGSISVLINNLIREKHDDFFPTHPSITEALLDREILEGSILEPACGDGAMSRVLLDYGYDVCSTDKIDRGFGTPGIDFLNADKQFSKLSYDCIVTNPPFRLGLEFILKAKDIARHKICILNSTTFLNGIERYEKLWMDREFPLKKMYQFSGRVAFRKNEVAHQSKPTGGYLSFCWFVFERGYIGSPTIEWILPERS